MKKDNSLLGQREFVSRLAKYSGYPKDALLDVLKCMEYVLADCLNDGYKVKLWSGFIMSIDEIAGKRYDFDTGEMLDNSYKRLNIKQSQNFKERFVNGGMIQRED